MKNSDFLRSLELVYGSVYGNSLAQDLVLSDLGMTANSAIANGISIQKVWDCLLEQTDQDTQLRYAYRFDQQELKTILNKN